MAATLSPFRESFSGELAAHVTAADLVHGAALMRFDLIVAPHLPAARRWAFYITRNRADADDVVQIASVRLMRAIAAGKFRGTTEASAKAWVRETVKHCALNLIGQRQLRLEPRAVTDHAPDGMGDEHDEVEAGHRDEGPNPERQSARSLNRFE